MIFLYSYYYSNTENGLGDTIVDAAAAAASSSVSDASTDEQLYSEALTVSVNAPRVKRSVLYQLKSFGSQTNINPLQLPPNIQIASVGHSASHFLAVTLG